MKKFIFTMIPFCVLISCSAPPPDAKRVFFLDSFNQVLQSDDFSIGLQDLFYTFRRMHQTADLITILNSGDLIQFQDEKAVPDENTLLYTLGNRRLKVHQTIYVTSKRNGDLFYSLDAKKWFPMANNRKKGINNIHYTYPAKSIVHDTNNRMEIHYQWTASLGESARESNMKEKEVVELEEGMIFLNSDNKGNSINLSDIFLKVPEGTEMQYDIRLSGNLIKSHSEDTINSVSILRDFFIYTTDDSDLKLGISTDGQNWNYNVFAFKFDVSGFFAADSPRDIAFYRNMDISYSF